jgi:hypothetical protein
MMSGPHLRTVTSPATEPPRQAAGRQVVRALLITLLLGYFLVRYAVHRYFRGE